MSEPLMPIARNREPRNPTPIDWELRLFLLAMGVVFAAWSFWQWLTCP